MVNPENPGRYIARETLVSALINGVISSGFFFAVFGGAGSVAVWGMGNYAFDFLPQSFAIALMASAVPALLARKAIASGKIAGSGGQAPAVRPLLGAALIAALVCALLGGAICAGVLWASRLETLDSVAALVAKVGYGALLGAFATRRMLKKLVA